MTVVWFLILLVLVGAVLGRVPPNSLVGIRTPWALADAQVWRRTHYLTGRLMALAGVALAGLASLGADQRDLLVALAACLAVVAASMYRRASV